jgi:glucose-6-phosphate 1-dehydrogenase
MVRSKESVDKAYEKYIFTKGLDMDDSKGEKLVSSDSKMACKDLQKIIYVAISPTIYSNAETLEVVKLCRNQNKIIINRDITPLIIPPIKPLYLKDGGNQFEHFTDKD